MSTTVRRHLRGRGPVLPKLALLGLALLLDPRPAAAQDALREGAGAVSAPPAPAPVAGPAADATGSVAPPAPAPVAGPAADATGSVALPAPTPTPAAGPAAEATGSVAPPAPTPTPAPPAVSAPAAGPATVEEEDEQRLLRYRFAELLLLARPPSLVEQVVQGPRQRPVDERELALLAGLPELARQVEQRERAVQRRWVLVGSGVAVVGLGLLVGAWLKGDPPPPPRPPDCRAAPCAVVFDTDVYLERLRAAVEVRDRHDDQRLALALGGASLELAAAVVIGLAAQATGGPHLSSTGQAELVRRHNEALARQLGLAGPPPPAQPSPPSPPPPLPAWEEESPYLR